MFELGRVVATPGAIKRAEQTGVSISALLIRHHRGDWGALDPDDAADNDLAVKDGNRIMSVYGTGPARLWIITEAETEVCPACWAGLGECEPTKGSWSEGIHWRDDLPARRLTTTVLLPEDY